MRGIRTKVVSAASVVALAGVTLAAVGPIEAHAIAVKPKFQVTSRVSVNSAGAQATEGYQPSITPDGRFVVFVMIDPTGYPAAGSLAQIFRRDQWTGIVVLVSTAYTVGAVPNGVANTPSISDDGRFVAFDSRASNLVKTDTNGHGDVFLKDMDSGITSTISVSSSGVAGNNDSQDASIDGAGDKVAFDSAATNLVANDSNAAVDVFVRSWIPATTIRASVSTGSAAGNGQSSQPSISGDGNSLTFVSAASNLVAGDTNGEADIFERSLPGSTTTRVSVVGATQADGVSALPVIDNDGSVVAFTSYATNLVAGDTNAHADTFTWTRGTKAVQRVSVNAFGGQLDQGSYLSDSISRDGNVVVWTSKDAYVTALLGDGTSPNVYTRDIGAAYTRMVDTRPDGNPGTSNFTLSTSTDQTGRYVAYTSSSPDLVRHDTNGNGDVFVTDTAFTVGPFANISDFVKQQFQDFIGRSPTASELTEGIAEITNGELSPSLYIVAKALGVPWGSTRAPVMRLYWAFFLREPDLGGLDYWVSNYHHGMSLDTIAQSFATSSEFKNTYKSLTNTAFVNLVYANVLVRAPDSAGRNYWVDQLTNHGLLRGTLMAKFSESSEGIRVIAPETDVVLLYMGMLTGVPSQAFFDQWSATVGSPAVPAVLAQHLLDSPSYASRFP